VRGVGIVRLNKAEMQTALNGIEDALVFADAWLYADEMAAA